MALLHQPTYVWEYYHLTIVRKACADLQKQQLGATEYWVARGQCDNVDRGNTLQRCRKQFQTDGNGGIRFPGDSQRVGFWIRNTGVVKDSFVRVLGVAP